MPAPEGKLGPGQMGPRRTEITQDPHTGARTPHTPRAAFKMGGSVEGLEARRGSLNLGAPISRNTRIVPLGMKPWSPRGTPTVGQPTPQQDTEIVGAQKGRGAKPPSPEFRKSELDRNPHMRDIGAHSTASLGYVGSKRGVKTRGRTFTPPKSWGPVGSQRYHASRVASNIPGVNVPGSWAHWGGIKANRRSRNVYP